MTSKVLSKKYLPVWLLAATVTAAITFLWVNKPTEKDEVESESIEKSESTFIGNTRTVQFLIEAHNPGNTQLSNQTVMMHIPVNDSAQYRHVNTESTESFELTESSDGKQLTIDLPLIAPFETKVIKVRSEIITNEKKSTIDVDAYLQDSPLLNMSEDPIKKKAAQLALGEKDKLAIAKNIHSWVNQHINYQGYLKNDRGALYAFNHQSGDCTEYMYLFASLARLNDIPTRLVGGFLNQGQATLKASNYHNWVEVFIDGQWHTVDPQNNYFIKGDSDYIAVMYLDEKNDFSNTHRFFQSSDELQVKVL